MGFPETGTQQLGPDRQQARLHPALLP
jgi:hypothetical protein